MTFAYPVFLDVGGVAVLMVGGGRVALRKATSLVNAGAIVTVVAPQVDAALRDVVATVERRPYRRGEAAGYQLVVTATSNAAVNAQVASDARQARVWVNSADDPTNCSFILPAIARRGDVTIAVSTDGASPALASRLRDVIERDVLTDQVEAAAADLARQRAEIHAAGGSTENIDWAGRLDNALGGHDGGSVT